MPKQDHPGTVYLLCFSRKLHHAAHYIGWAKCLEKRLEHHRAGTGARLMAACKREGITFTLARTWEGDKNLERKLKKKKCAPKLCPLCRAKAKGETT